MKNHTATIGMLCLTTLTIGGCVMTSTYDAAVADLDMTKAERASISIQSQGLTEQVSELQQLKIDRARQMEAASSALQQARQRMEAEYSASQERLSKLSRMISQLTAQQNSLQSALKRAIEEQARLQAAVDRYHPTSGETGGFSASRSPQSIAPTNEPAETAMALSAQAPAPNEPAPQPTMTTQAAPADPTAANQNPQPAGKQTSEPVEEGWLPTIKGWVITLWRSIFS